MRKRNTKLALATAAALTGSLVVLANLAGTGTAEALIAPPKCITGDCSSPSASAAPTSSATPTSNPTPTASASAPDAKPTTSDTQGPGPTITADPTDTSAAPVSGAATVSGTFTLGNGSALANYPVTLSAVDAVPTDGTSAAPDVVGTTTTASDGSWTFTLPDPLPADLQSLADANGGVLNLEADVTGTAPDGTVLAASDFVSAGVAEGSSTTPLSADVRADASPETVAVAPIPQSTTDAQPPTDAQAASSYGSQVEASNDANEIDATPPMFQNDTGASTAGYNPQVVGGVSYAAVTPDRTIPCATREYTLKTGIYYTVVGEAHAFWDATATFDYSDKLSTTWTVAYSTDGTDFKMSGSKSLGSSSGHEITVNGGPFWAHQIKVPIKYVEVESAYECGGITDSRTYKILPVDYDAPAGGATAEVGADVSSKDGGGAYAGSNKNYRNVVPPQNTFSLTHGDTSSYGTGVTAFGVSLTVTSGYDTNHYEKITTGKGEDGHDIWGLHGRPGGDSAAGGTHVGVFYSY